MALNCEGGFYRAVSGTPQFTGVSPKRWTIEQTDPAKNTGITIYFTGTGLLTGGPSGENPVWKVTVGHDIGQSEFKLDAYRGSTLGMPAKKITLEALIEDAGQAAAPNRFVDFGFTAIEGCFQRSAPNYTFLKNFALTVSGGATPDTGQIVIPTNTRALLPMANLQTALATLRIEVYDASNNILLQQLVNGVRFGIPGNAAFVKLINTSGALAPNVSCMAESSF